MTDRDWIILEPAPMTYEEHLAAFCLSINCHPTTLLGLSRRRRIAWARQDFMLLLNEAGFAYAEIGRLMNRHHTTIMDGAERARARRLLAPVPRPPKPKAKPLRAVRPRTSKPAPRPIDPHIAFLAAVVAAHPEARAR